MNGFLVFGLRIRVSEEGAGDIVSIMIGNLKGTKILQSIQRGIQVTMVIEVGKKHGPWMNHYSIFFVSVSFFIVTAATVGYFIFYSARRLRNARAQNRKQRQLKADAKRAIGKLQLRALKHGDKETGPDGDSCAVCIEIFRPNDIVRILTCNHLFHKTCIDPWLLEHRTCPMCKCDILKALGVEADVEAGTVSFQTAGSNPNINGSPESYSPREEDSHSETASSGYASVQGADEPPLEERAQSQSKCFMVPSRCEEKSRKASGTGGLSCGDLLGEPGRSLSGWADDHLRLVNHDASSVAVDVLPQLDNPAFEADEPSVLEAPIHPIKS
ncbi:E3 ubiquitin-protein ligase RNF128 [Trichosurus vulpecula]|uniref:E3 ubiquitin-protein ligase RNF128 n=1 Tax=Trichosurus vulpecula TaxID=9337 RepID=UPI00186B3798|nr:E3 ubiquitin-protein ligase RNF128 [Trichosurus vulpecula]